MGPVGDATPIQTQDFFVTAKVVGEFGITPVLPGDRVERLFNFIKDLAEPVVEKHKKENCDDAGALKPDRKDHLTRLMTSEFLFYTQTPLTLTEFKYLQQSIVDYAKAQPENLQLILSSFAVLTPDNKVANVVAHIECGPKPKINFITKNNPSAVDPNYRGETGRLIPNLKIEGDKTPLPSIEIDGKEHQFSKNCIMECTTAGGQRYLSCVEICLDHDFEVAKNSFNTYLQQAVLQGKQDIPTTCSHVLTSGTCSAQPDKTIGTMFHVDAYRKQEPALETEQEKRSANYRGTFNVIERASVPIGPLANVEMRMVDECNRGELSLATAVSLHLTDDVKRILAKGGEDLNHRYENGETILLRAIKNNDADIVEVLLDHEPKLARRSIGSMFALHYAAEYGNARIIAKVLAHSQEFIDAPTNTGSTPLHFAATSGNAEAVKQLLHAGANVEALDKKNYLPVGLAYKYQNFEMAYVLIQHSDQVKKNGETALTAAVLMNLPRLVDYIIKNHPELVAQKNSTQYTALHMAASYGYTDIVKHLMRDPKAAQQKDGLGRYPIELAIQTGHEKAVKLLMKNPPFDLATDLRAQKYLHIAAEKGLTGIAAMLVAAGVDSDKPNENGVTAKQLAQSNGHTETYEKLAVFRPNIPDVTNNLTVKASEAVATQAAVHADDKAHEVHKPRSALVAEASSSVPKIEKKMQEEPREVLTETKKKSIFSRISNALKSGKNADSTSSAAVKPPKPPKI